MIVVTRDNPPCVYCKNAKEFLDSRKINYREIKLTEDVASQLRELGIRTVPAIFFKDKISRKDFIGGYEELRNLYEVI